MNKRTTHRYIRQLLAGTGVALPAAEPRWTPEALIRLALLLIHGTLLLGMGYMLTRLWSIYP